MTFPAAGGTTFPYTLDAAWQGARNAAAQVKQQAVALNSQISAGPVSAQVIITSLSFFITLNNQLTTYAATPGIAAYAQAQINNPSLDVVGAFTSMQNALTSVNQWVVSNFPVDTGGFLQAIQFVSGVPTYTTFTQAQLSGLATLLTALTATIS